MSDSNHPTNPVHPSSEAIPLSDLSFYEMAVLSTLTDQEDANKVLDLAAHWGYQEEFLHSIWHQLHSHRIAE